jgi:hypothetical protein
MRKYRWWIGFGILALVGAITWTVATSTDVDFTPALWIATDSPLVDDRTLRQRMLGDLFARHKLVGLTRDSVIGLLGEPPKTGYFKDWQLVYWLGPEQRFLALDSEWLVMKVDSAGKVVEAEVRTD